MSTLKIGDQTVFFETSERMSTIPDDSVNFVITSPPYWNLKDYGSDGEIGKSSYEDYLRRLNVVWQECFRVAKNGAILVININTRRVKKQFYPIPFDIANRMKGWNFWDHVIWYVPNALPQPNHYIERLLDNKFESCLVFVKGHSDEYKFHKPRVPQKYLLADPRVAKKNPRGRCVGNIIRIPAYRPPNVKDLGYHVAAYPEELAAFFMECYTDPGDMVLDPFLGSGTTLKVARVMERKGIGFELNSDFRVLVGNRINEEWQVPDWRQLDILHSATNEPGVDKPRKAQFLKADQKRLQDEKNGQGLPNLFSDFSRD